MSFRNALQSYFNLRTFDERKKKIQKILDQLKKIQQDNDPIVILNLIETYTEHCLLVENNYERNLLYERALKLVNNARSMLRETNQLRHLLRSYHNFNHIM